MVNGKSPEWLPSGFSEKTKYRNGIKIKYYNNSATGIKYYSKKDVLRCENVCHDMPQATSIEDNKLSDDKTGCIEPKTMDSSEWLPHGWIVEERTRKSGSRMGTTYRVYIEPSTGRRFYSKSTVTRYLKTLIHTRNTTKQIKSSCLVDETQSEQPETSRQLFLGQESNEGKESCDRNSSVTPEPENLNQDKIVERKNDREKTFEDIDPYKRVTAEKIAVSSLGSDSLNDQKSPESVSEKQIHKAPMDSRKSKKSVTPSLPRRSSKRLAGCEPETLPDLVLDTRGLRATTKKSAHEKAGANEFPWQPDAEPAQEAAYIASINLQTTQQVSEQKVDGANKFPREPHTEPAQEVANCVSVGQERVLDIEPSSTISVQIDPSENQTIPNVQMSREVTEQEVDHNTKSQDSHLDFSFGDSWSDPCLEFAVKTLTGIITVEDALAFQGCFQQKLDVPFNEAYGSLQQPAVDAPSNSEPFKQHVPVEQWPVNPPFPTPGNIRFPNCSGVSR
ncbi:Uncharacterized protein Adt_10101 [Abeliophyllum distichum]|uniref:MBD domain-containing protein n=1 Tax=Abeliophyllum distichum TaxID=126358 RepID=A0ABD1UJ82_9LAMI